MSQLLLEWSVLYLLVVPLLIGGGLGAGLLLGIRPSERWIKQITIVYFVSSLSVCLLLFTMLFYQSKPIFWNYPIFKRYKIDFILTIDLFSLLYLFLSVILMGLINRFSFTYLHRELGFHRFFILLYLAAFGIHLILFAGCLDTLWMGWEFLGLSSILLVAFFQERKGPAQNGLYIFIIYRLGDIALLAAGLWLHTKLGTTHYQQIMTPASLASLQAGALFSPAFMIGFLIIVAAVIKAGLLPFLNWLPRAMEGPTPSSAIFYGALSTHIGVFILIRLYPMLQGTPGLLPLLIVLGALSAALGSLFARVQTDAKNALAYSAIVQLGLMFIEIGFGWLWLAQIHLFSHAILRSYQFLKVPSALHIHHEMVSLYGQDFSPTGFRVERFLPLWMQRLLYFVAMERAFLDETIERLFIQPIHRLSNYLHHKEEQLMVYILQKSTLLTPLKPSTELSHSAKKKAPESLEPPLESPVSPPPTASSTLSSSSETTP